MASAFGFSAGDFISGINLVQHIVRALNDSKGSSKEYLQVIAELRSIESALLQIKSQQESIVKVEQKQALSQAVQECDNSMKNFLESLTQYHGHLSTVGSGNRCKDALRKVQWRLCKADELASFRSCLSSHVQSIQMILATIQVSQLNLSSSSAQAQETELKGQSAALLDVSDSVRIISQSFEDIKFACASNGALNQQVLGVIESTKQLSILQHVEILKVLRAIQEAIPPQVLLQKPVMFLDALGRLAPIHLDWINSYEAFLAVLKVRFKHHGLHLIEEKCFVLQATRTKRDVNFNLPWDCCLIPGQEYDMSMIFQHPGAATEAICVSCHHACAGQAGNDVTCQNCGTTFRRVAEADQTDIYVPRISSFSKVTRTFQTDHSTTSQILSSEHQAEIQDFQRVRVLCGVVDLSTRRCRMDTGSDVNLISESTVLDLGLPFTRGRYPELTGIGGAQVFPIGALLLRLRMSGHPEITFYERFYVISQDTPALFDALIGRKWIKDNKTLLRPDLMSNDHT